MLSTLAFLFIIVAATAVIVAYIRLLGKNITEPITELHTMITTRKCPRCEALNTDSLLERESYWTHFVCSRCGYDVRTHVNSANDKNTR